MGAACSSSETPEQKEQRRRNVEIERQLAQTNRELRTEVKMLLLGPGESGKSTIFKQMKIIQNNGGYTRPELESYKFIVYGNCITQMKVLLNAAYRLGIQLDNQEHMAAAERINALGMGGEAWSKQVAQDIHTLWHDRGIQETFGYRDKKYQLNDSANYFFDKALEFAEDNYCPSEQDVLRARVRSTGVEEAEFKFDDLTFRMLDVGGQRSERRKWIHCFDSVTAVIFCAALSEYDQTLREDDTQNRMRESIDLFEEICNWETFAQTPFVLFLNKMDIFREKITKVDLSICFPDYKGGKNFDNASGYIKQQFLDQNRSPHAIYVHLTCAISTQNVEFVFRVVRDTLMKKVINELF